MEYKHDEDKRYLFYCPRCGYIESSFANEYNLKRLKEGKRLSLGSCWYCGQEIPMLDFIGRKSIKLVNSGHTQSEWGEHNPDIPYDVYHTTLEMCEFIWEKYVDIPENTALNREAFEREKDKTIYFYETGGLGGHIDRQIQAQMYRDDTPVRCPKCSSTSITTQSGFNTGKAVAGAVIAGAAGAIIGGKAGNKAVNVCQSCGHKWEPGK